MVALSISFSIDLYGEITQEKLMGICTIIIETGTLCPS